MDELSRELELFEVIAASDAMNNARTFLEVCAEDPQRGGGGAVGGDPSVRVPAAGGRARPARRGVPAAAG